MAAGTPGTISNLTPALRARLRFGGRAGQQRVAGEQPDRELPVLRRLHQHPGRARGVGRARPGVASAAQVASGDGRPGPARPMTRLACAEQLGRAHRQQPLVAGTRADEGDPSRRFLPDRTSTSAHCTSFPLLGGRPADCWRDLPPRDASISRRQLAPEPGCVAAPRRHTSPLRRVQSAGWACRRRRARRPAVRSCSVPRIAYAPTGALQPGLEGGEQAALGGHRGRVGAWSTRREQLGQLGVIASALNGQRALAGRGQHLVGLEDLGDQRRCGRSWPGPA